MHAPTVISKEHEYLKEVPSDLNGRTPKFRFPPVDWTFLLISGFFIGSFTIHIEWRFTLASLAILICGRVAYGKEWLGRMGLHVPKWQIPVFLAAWSGLILLSGVLLPILSHQAGLDYLPNPGPLGWLWKLALISQVMNEEILLRGMLLPKLMRWLGSENQVMVFSVLVFCSLHALLYTYLTDVQLSQGTFLTLLGFCLIVNLLYLRTGHIAYSFALHAGWNLNRFTADYQQAGYRLTEAQSFNAIEGRLWPGVLLLLGCVWLFWPKSRAGPTPSSKLN